MSDSIQIEILFFHCTAKRCEFVVIVGVFEKMVLSVFFSNCLEMIRNVKRGIFLKRDMTYLDHVNVIHEMSKF